MRVLLHRNNLINKPVADKVFFFVEMAINFYSLSRLIVVANMCRDPFIIWLPLTSGDEIYSI
jgi:hypothetical protein